MAAPQAANATTRLIGATRARPLTLGLDRTESPGCFLLLTELVLAADPVTTAYALQPHPGPQGLSRQSFWHLASPLLCATSMTNKRPIPTVLSRMVVGLATVAIMVTALCRWRARRPSRTSHTVWT